MKTRKCNQCGRVLDLTKENWRWRNRDRRDGYILVFEYDCRICARIMARKARLKDRLPPIGDGQGRQRGHEHTGPLPGSVEHKFFCR